MRHLQVNIIDLELGVDATADSEIMRAVGKAIFASFLTANPTLQEPIYKIIITVASELSGECSRILTTKRGKVILFEQKGLLAKLPVIFRWLKLLVSRWSYVRRLRVEQFGNHSLTIGRRCPRNSLWKLLLVCVNAKVSHWKYLRLRSLWSNCYAA